MEKWMNMNLEKVSDSQLSQGNDGTKLFIGIFILSTFMSNMLIYKTLIISANVSFVYKNYPLIS